MPREVRTDIRRDTVIDPFDGSQLQQQLTDDAH